MDGTLRDNSSIGAQLVIIVFSGFFALFFPILPLVRIYQAQKWNEVSFRILSSELKETRGSKGKRSYLLNLSYTYEVGARTYQSDRYDFMGFINSEATKRGVVQTYRKGAEATCYVNPTIPGDAVLNRNASKLLWFGAIPIGVMLAAISGLIFRRRAQQINTAGEVQLVSSNRQRMYVLLVMAVCFSAATVGIGWFARDELWKSFNALHIFLIVFSLGALALWCGAIQETLRYLKFGESTFNAKCLPAVLGGTLEGLIAPQRTSRLYGAEKQFTLTLQSLHQYSVGSGKSRQTHVEILWEDTQKVESSDGRLPIAFYIPEDAFATGKDDGGGYYLWHLKVTSERPGVDYSATFEIPIIEGEISADQKQRIADGGVFQATPPVELEPSFPAERQVRIEEDRSGATVFVFPAMAHRLALLFMAAPTAFIAFWLYQVSHIFSVEDPFFFGFGIIFCLVAVSSLGGVYGRLYRPSRTVVDSTGITIFTRRFGFPVSKRFSREEIEAIEVKRGGDNPSVTASSVQIRCRDGKEIAAGYHVKDRREAEWVAAEMSRLLGIGVKHEQANQGQTTA